MKKAKLLAHIPEGEFIEIWATINGYEYEIDAETTVVQLFKGKGRYRLVVNVTTEPDQPVQILRRPK